MSDKSGLVVRLKSLKVLLGVDSPEVRGWSIAVRQAAQKTVNDAIAALTAQQPQEAVAWAVRNKKDGYWAGIWNDRECAERVCSKGRGDDEILAMRVVDCNHDGSQSGSQRTLMPSDTSNRDTAPPSGAREDIHKRLMNLYHAWRQGENRQIDSHWAAMSLLSAMLPPERAAEQVNAEGRVAAPNDADAIRPSPAPSAPNAGQVVPVEPTEAMLDELLATPNVCSRSDMRKRYAAMLRAAGSRHEW